jgi:cytoskeletal protein CcmA (bactofilin family)
MKTWSKAISVLLLVLVLVFPSHSAQARGLSQGRVIFGENFTLSAGQTLEGDLVVLGGNVTIEKDAVVLGSMALFGGNAEIAAGAQIDGDVALFGGNMNLAGKVNGDVAVFGGQVLLRKTAVVNGDVAGVGGQVHREEGAQVAGEVITNAPAPRITIPPAETTVPPVPVSPSSNLRAELEPLWRAFKTLYQAMAMGLIAMLVALFLQPQMTRIAQAVTAQPLIAGGVGLVTLIAVPLALVLLAITIILLPVSLVGALVLVLAWLLGVIAVGQEVGERFTQMLHQTWAPVLTAGFGTFLLMLVSGIVGMIPCIGWLFPFAVGLLGLGGVTMTYFGGRVAPSMAAPASGS